MLVRLPWQARVRITFAIDFVSLSESLDTGTPLGKMIFTVLAAVAELERNLIKERAQMGISRPRKQDKQLGRRSGSSIERKHTRCYRPCLLPRSRGSWALAVVFTSKSSSGENDKIARGCLSTSVTFG